MRDRETVLKALEHCSRRLGCNTCPYDHGCGRQSLLLEDAAKLLKEQEPVKPIFDEEDVSGRCGVCGHALTHQSMVGEVLVDEWFQYCPICGRKVDWNA